MNISLPDDMKAFVDGQVSERGFGTSSEYLRDLIRKEQERLQMRQLMLDALASPVMGVADRTYFDSYRQRAAEARKAQPASRKTPRGRKSP